MSYSGTWYPPPERLVLSADEIHVWRANLRVPGQQLESYYHTLSLDERTRAAKFHFSKDHNDFVAARGILRNILARYLGQDAAALRFCYNSAGKPAVMPVPQNRELQFNLAHSHGLALYAFACSPVGIDLEWIQPWRYDPEIAEMLFSSRERSELMNLPEQERAEAFFRNWVCKEAYVKARGQGLSIPLRSFDVCIKSAAAAPRLSDPQWSVQTFTPGLSYVAAVVVEGHGRELRLFE